MELLSVDTQLLWVGLTRLDAKADRLLSGQSIVRRVVEKQLEVSMLHLEVSRLKSALPSFLPKNLRCDWVAAFGSADTLELKLEVFIQCSKSHVQSEAWGKLMTGLSVRCGMDVLLNCQIYYTHASFVHALLDRLIAEQAKGHELCEDVQKAVAAASKKEDDGDRLSDEDEGCVSVQEVAMRILAEQYLV
jgi:hypothetical protein